MQQEEFQRRKKIPKRIFRKEAFSVGTDFISLNVHEKQQIVERLFSTTRRKLHPLIRMDDILNPSKCCTISNLVKDMPNYPTNKKGVWYNISVALDRDRHLSTPGNWRKLVDEIRSSILQQTSSAEQKRKQEWKVDLFPATQRFVVDHVINESANYKRNAASSAPPSATQHNLKKPPMHHEPMYHMYIECTFPELAVGAEDIDDSLEHMDIMYNRWSIQNPVLLRQRILERYTEELLRRENQTDLKSKVVLNKYGDV